MFDIGKYKGITIADSVVSSIMKDKPMVIQVEKNDWGEAAVEDIQSLLENVRDQLLRHFSDPPSGRVIVHYTPDTPVNELRKSPQDDHSIWLCVKNRLWAQFSYQFAHEFCHVLCGTNEKQYQKPNQWFHEVISELASIFALKQMAVNWPENPPYVGWSNYAQNLDEYANKIIDSVKKPSDGLNDWLGVYEPTLRDDPYQKNWNPERELNKIVAVELFPLFQKAPHHWQSVADMPSTPGSFETYLTKWHQQCPAGHKSFVRQIACIFGVSL